MHDKRNLISDTIVGQDIINLTKSKIIPAARHKNVELIDVLIGGSADPPLCNIYFVINEKQHIIVLATINTFHMQKAFWLQRTDL